MFSRKQSRPDETDRPGTDEKDNTQEKTPNELRLPTGPDQGFVYYEE